MICLSIPRHPGICSILTKSLNLTILFLDIQSYMESYCIFQLTICVFVGFEAYVQSYWFVEFNDIFVTCWLANQRCKWRESAIHLRKKKSRFSIWIDEEQNNKSLKCIVLYYIVLYLVYVKGSLVQIHLFLLSLIILFFFFWRGYGH